MKIVDKISLSFFGVSLVLITITGMVSYTVGRFSLADAICNHLETSANLHAEMIKSYLETLKKSAVQVSKSVVLPAALNTAKDSPGYGKAIENAVKLLMSKKDADSSAYKYMLLDASGSVVASSKRTDIGLDRSMDAYFLGAKKSVYIKDAHYSQREKLALMAVSAPIIDSNTGLFLGVLVENVTLDALYHITTDRTGLGRTGEVVIINKYGYLISPSRYEENIFLRKRITTDMTRRILQYRAQGSLSVHKELLNEYSDYRGVPVLGMYDYITDPGWGIIVKIDSSEVFAPLFKLRNMIFIIILAALLLSWFSGVVLAASITEPIRRLYKGTEIIGDGNLDYKVGVNTKDEVGQLSRAFDQMTQDLKKTTTSIDNLNKEISERERVEQQHIEDQEVLKSQTLELNAALKESFKSREILSSMLADNNQIRKKLEQHIAELKLSQDMLIQSEKLASLGKLVASMAHEVNNPLMIISGNAQLSLMEGTKEEEIKNNLKIIIEECHRAKNIIQRLLKFSRPSKGETKEVDINKSIEATVGIMEHPFKVINVVIKRNYQENLPLISIDEPQMQEVFMNLVNNAAEAMPGGGVLTITTSLEGDFLRIDFKDTGSGVLEEVKKRLFEPFFTTKEKGTGLGLPVCYGIIKAHNGEMRFESELNKGTAVSVLLPLGGG